MAKPSAVSRQQDHISSSINHVSYNCTNIKINGLLIILWVHQAVRLYTVLVCIVSWDPALIEQLVDYAIQSRGGAFDAPTQ